MWEDVVPWSASTSRWPPRRLVRDGLKAWQQVVERGYEGLIAKDEASAYEGAPIPLKPLKRWDNACDVVLAGDAAGIVAPASGEGIYYAMAGGRFAADAVEACLETGDARTLADARTRFMKAPPAKVFAAWTDPEKLLRWFGPDSSPVLSESYALACYRNRARPKGCLGPEGPVSPENVLTKAPSAEL